MTPVPAKPVAKAAVAPAAAAAAAAAVAAPQTVQLTGVVLRPDGQPCAGASVFPALSPRQLVVTDAQGAFALPVPAGLPISLQVDLYGEGSSRLRLPGPPAEPLRIVLGQ